jgi:hypothetical protein
MVRDSLKLRQDFHRIHGDFAPFGMDKVKGQAIRALRLWTIGPEQEKIDRPEDLASSVQVA